MTPGVYGSPTNIIPYPPSLLVWDGSSPLCHPTAEVVPPGIPSSATLVFTVRLPPSPVLRSLSGRHSSRVVSGVRGDETEHGSRGATGSGHDVSHTPVEVKVPVDVLCPDGGGSRTLKTPVSVEGPEVRTPWTV